MWLKIEFFADRPLISAAVGQDSNIYFRAIDVAKFLGYCSPYGFSMRYASVDLHNLVPTPLKSQLKRILVFSFDEMMMVIRKTESKHNLSCNEKRRKVMSELWYNGWVSSTYPLRLAYTMHDAPILRFAKDKFSGRYFSDWITYFTAAVIRNFNMIEEDPENIPYDFDMSVIPHYSPGSPGYESPSRDVESAPSVKSRSQSLPTRDPNSVLYYSPESPSYYSSFENPKSVPCYLSPSHDSRPQSPFTNPKSVPCYSSPQIIFTGSPKMTNLKKWYRVDLNSEEKEELNMEEDGQNMENEENLEDGQDSEDGQDLNMGDLNMEESKEDLEDGQDLNMEDGQDLILEDGQDLNLEDGQDLILEDGQDLILEDGQDLILDNGQDLNLDNGQDLNLDNGQDLNLDNGQDTPLDPRTKNYSISFFGFPPKQITVNISGEIRQYRDSSVCCNCQK